MLYVKVHEKCRLVSKSCHIAAGISEKGDREILGLLIGERESELACPRFFQYFKGRGLEGLKMVVSDDHKDRVSAIKENFTVVSWQRCQVHFLRIAFSSIPKKNSTSFREGVKAVFRLIEIS